MKKVKKGLSDKTLEEIHNVLFVHLMDTMFGDGCERDYIVDGINFPGLANMSDEELIQELEACGFDDLDEENEEYQLLQRARAEYGRDECKG